MKWRFIFCTLFHFLTGERASEKRDMATHIFAIYRPVVPILLREWGEKVSRPLVLSSSFFPFTPSFSLPTSCLCSSVQPSHSLTYTSSLALLPTLNSAPSGASSAAVARGAEGQLFFWWLVPCPGLLTLHYLALNQH